MQNNSQRHRDRFNPKAESIHEDHNTRPDIRGLRAKSHPVDEAAPAGVMKNFVSGMVIDCLKLNVRKDPSADAEVLTIIDALSKVMVDMDTSTDAFYKVFTKTGIEGFCMKKYITLKK